MKEGITAVSATPLSMDWMDPLEQVLRDGVHRYLRQLLEEEVTAVLGRLRYGRQEAAIGYRNGHRHRTLFSTLGRLEVDVPRARLHDAEGHWNEFRSAVLPRYERLTKGAMAVIAGAYLAGVNTRRVRRALGSLFGTAVSKDAVSRAWRRVHTDFEVWQKRSLKDEPIVRLILDATFVKARLDRKATVLPILVALGVRADGQKVLLALRVMGSESTEAWRDFLEALIARDLRTPELVSVDGGQGLGAAVAMLWPAVPVQRCTVHKLRNLLAHAPKRLHDEIAADYSDMIYATTPATVQARRRAFLSKWKLKCRAVTDSLAEAGDQLFTFLRYPPEQWRSLRTTNAIERLHEEFKRRIKTQCALPCAETACMLFWALLASGEITLRKVDGCRSLNTPPVAFDLAA